MVITNKKLIEKNTITYHNGRGSQENILAHNLTRELQMISSSPVRTTQEKRLTLWKFKTLGILRRQIIQRAGRIIQPQGKIVLSMAKNDAVKDEMLHYLDRTRKAV